MTSAWNKYAIWGFVFGTVGFFICKAVYVYIPSEPSNSHILVKLYYTLGGGSFIGTIGLLYKFYGKAKGDTKKLRESMGLNDIEKQRFDIAVRRRAEFLLGLFLRIITLWVTSFVCFFVYKNGDCYPIALYLTFSFLLSTTPYFFCFLSAWYDYEKVCK